MGVTTYFNRKLRRLLQFLLIYLASLKEIIFITSAEMNRVIKVQSWNVNGLRSLLKHDFDNSVLPTLLNRRNVDILCLQETKISDDHTKDMELELKNRLGHHVRMYWNCSKARKGYSGTATIVLNSNIKVSAVSFENLCEIGFSEGRIITLETPEYSVTNCYVPNSGSKLDRLDYRVNVWDRHLGAHLQALRSRRPTIPNILVGDLNVAHTALDYYNCDNPRTKKQAATTPEEQHSFFENILKHGFIDTFRSMYPYSREYSFFSSLKGEEGRKKREGLRIDYVLIDSQLEYLNVIPYIEEKVGCS